MIELSRSPHYSRRPDVGRIVRRSEQGQSLLEFAFIIPVLFLMLVGVAFIAQGFNISMVLHGAAYEGARVWARNPHGGDANHCNPPACDPNAGDAINFEKYVIPVVRQYVKNNGLDGESVFFFADNERQFRNVLGLVSNNRQIVRVVLLYPVKLPIGNFASNFVPLYLEASCTMKRGS